MPRELGIRVDPNQEMVGLGAANLAAGFFQGFPISSSSSRTPVAEAAGAKTQLTGVVGALVVAAAAGRRPDLLQASADAALAAVVIASAIGLFEFADLRRIYRIQRWEFWLSIAVLRRRGRVRRDSRASASPIVIAVIEFLWDGWRPHSAVLGRAEGVKGYHDITRYPDARQIPGLVLFRWDAPLFFANAELFQERVLDAVDASPTPVRRLVVAAEPVTSVDVTAADALAELDDKLAAAGIELCFAELKDPVKDKLRRFGLFAAVRRRRLLPHDRLGGRRLLRSPRRRAAAVKPWRSSGPSTGCLAELSANGRAAVLGGGELNGTAATAVGPPARGPAGVAEPLSAQHRCSRARRCTRSLRRWWRRKPAAPLRAAGAARGC